MTIDEREKRMLRRMVAGGAIGSAIGLLSFHAGDQIAVYLCSPVLLVALGLGRVPNWSDAQWYPFVRVGVIALWVIHGVVFSVVRSRGAYACGAVVAHALCLEAFPIVRG